MPRNLLRYICLSCSIGLALCMLIMGLSGCEQSRSENGPGPDKKNIETNDKKGENKRDNEALLKAGYKKWLDAEIASGEFCSSETCAGEYEKFEQDTDYEMQCMIGLPDDAEFIMGDLNGDEIPDAFADVPWEQCDGGNALRTASTMILFLSNDEGYMTLADPEAFSSMGIGGIGKIEGGVLFGHGLEFHEDDPMCCPSIEWDVEYAVKDGKVIETKITEKVRAEDAE